jgi:NAD(P)-dependent dehydrogenase (short-subunit alcohol dehydrogenase family)
MGYNSNRLIPQKVNMKTIVITGSTRGIGFAMARAFLRKDSQVVISGRQATKVKAAVQKLVQENSPDRVAGFACDVTQFDQLETLWKNAQKNFGQVDIWVNNAGISNQQNPSWELSDKEIRAVVETNVLGEMFGSKVALQGFIQQGFGALYNMEGMGANRKSGNVKGLSIYGASKAGLRYFNDSLANEISNPKIIIGFLQPGMMLTDMVTGQYTNKPEQWARDKRIFEVLASDVDQVADWLTDQMLKNKKNGARFSFSNSFKIFSRFLLMPLKKKEA